MRGTLSECLPWSPLQQSLQTLNAGFSRTPGDAALHETVSLACRYKDVLGEAASQISQLYDASHTALVVNLGPAWLSGEAYELFNSNVIEIPFKDWESPPGLGICPLGVIFTVCSSIASWLALNEGNVVVSAEATPHACPTSLTALCIPWQYSDGLGICQLVVISIACSSIASWLALHGGHVGMRDRFSLPHL